jgi:ketosteroid isomerase-like protein
VTASANLDLVRSICAGWERGDYSSTGWAHPEIEFAFADGPAPGSWTGLPAMAKAMRDLLSPWEEFHQEVDQVRELDDERVLGLLNWGGRGKTSGVELGQIRSRGASIFHIRRGKVTRLVAYLDRERALADLGLAPEATTPDS